MAKNILKEAIADAKAVREVALANAKAALEEAFTPRLQSMLSAELSEELDEGEDKEAFREELLTTYGNTYKVRTDSESQTQLKSIIAGIKSVFVLVSFLFLGVLFVTVFNDTVLSIRENQKNLGILKAIGLTPLQLQLALVLKAVSIAILALIIGVPLSLQIIPHAMDVLTANVGLAQFPYVFDLNKTLLNIPLILVLTIGSVWIASQRLLKIRPRILVRE